MVISTIGFLQSFAFWVFKYYGYHDVRIIKIIIKGKDVPSYLRGNYYTQTTEPDKSVGYSLTKLKMHM